jgi:hypothetical protein
MKVHQLAGVSLWGVGCWTYLALPSDLSILYSAGRFAAAAQFGNLTIEDHRHVHGIGIGRFTIH